MQENGGAVESCHSADIAVSSLTHRPGLASEDVGRDKDHASSAAIDESPRPAKIWLVVALRFALEQWFLIGIGVFIVLAWAFPNFGKEAGSSLWGDCTYFPHYWALVVFSFLVFPAVIYAILNIIRASGTTKIDPFIEIGLIMMAVVPTTVASNITMTTNAKGSAEAATIEVCIGNFLGCFLTPLLLEMFTTGKWSYGAPVPSGGLEGAAGLREIYKQLAKQLGLAIFVPLFVGQVVQNIFPTKAKWAVTKLYLGKVSSFFLLILIWSTFSTQFAEHAFQSVSPASIIMVVFLNLGLYLIFTAVCLALTRLPWIPDENNLTRTRSTIASRMLKSARFEKPEGIVIGAPIVSILYGGLDDRNRAIVSIPLVLYQGEQVAVAQILVAIFRRWNEKEEGRDLPTFTERIGMAENKSGSDDKNA